MCRAISLPSGVSKTAGSKCPAQLIALAQASWAVPTYSRSVQPNSSVSQPGRRHSIGWSGGVCSKMAAVRAIVSYSGTCQVIC